jgi:RimJ/RimL family protein N-acetyltransferase
MSDPWTLTDGAVTIRPPREGETAVLVAGRDGEWARWLGPGSDDPRPTACIVVDGTIVGWVDYDPEPDWLGEGEVNIGYNVFAPYRGRGYARRGVVLLMALLASEGVHRVAIASIDVANEASQRAARGAGFELVGERDGSLRFARPIARMRGET